MTLSKTKFNPQGLEQELIEIQEQTFLYLNITHQKTRPEHEVFRMMFLKLVLLPQKLCVKQLEGLWISQPFGIIL